MFPSEWYPSLFVMVFFMIFFCPFPVLYHDARQWLIITLVSILHTLHIELTNNATLKYFIHHIFPLFYQTPNNSQGKVISSPFSPVEFGSFFLADAMNSLTNSLVGMGVFICVYSKHWNQDTLGKFCIDPSICIVSRLDLG